MSKCTQNAVLDTQASKISEDIIEITFKNINTQYLLILDAKVIKALINKMYPFLF